MIYLKINRKFNIRFGEYLDHFTAHNHCSGCGRWSWCAPGRAGRGTPRCWGPATPGATCSGSCPSRGNTTTLPSQSSPIATSVFHYMLKILTVVLRIIAAQPAYKFKVLNTQYMLKVSPFNVLMYYIDVTIGDLAQHFTLISAQNCVA